MINRAVAWVCFLAAASLILLYLVFPAGCRTAGAGPGPGPVSASSGDKRAGPHRGEAHVAGGLPLCGLPRVRAIDSGHDRAEPGQSLWSHELPVVACALPIVVVRARFWRHWSSFERVSSVVARRGAWRVYHRSMVVFAQVGTPHTLAGF